MGAPTYSDFSNRFAAFGPKLLSDDAGVQSSLVSRMSYHWDQHSAWKDDRRKEAALLLAAHDRQLGLDEASGKRSGGQRTRSKAAGQWSKTMAEAKSSKAGTAAYYQTTWGQQYVDLKGQTRRFPLTGGRPR